MIGNMITRLRKEKGLTQSKFAELIHVTQGAVSQWETGRTSPDVQQMFILADFFGVTIEELTNGEYSSTKTPHLQPEPQPAPKVNIMFRTDVPNYLEKLNPKNRAFLEEMARKLFELQQQEENK